MEEVAISPLIPTDYQSPSFFLFFFSSFFSILLLLLCLFQNLFPPPFPLSHKKKKKEKEQHLFVYKINTVRMRSSCFLLLLTFFILLRSLEFSDHLGLGHKKQSQSTRRRRKRKKESKIRKKNENEKREVETYTEVTVPDATRCPVPGRVHALRVNGAGAEVTLHQAHIPPTALAAHLPSALLLHHSTILGRGTLGSCCSWWRGH